MRILYAKGGRAIAEAVRLFPLAGSLPDGGPDKYLLGVLGNVLAQPFRLVSFGPISEKRIINNREVYEYGVRPNHISRIAKRFAYIRESFRFMFDTLKWKPTHIFCGIDGPFAVFAYLAAKLVKAKFIFLVHNALTIPTTSRAYKIAHRLIVKRSDTVIVHGPFLLDQALVLGADKKNVYEFNNGLDNDHKVIIDNLKNNFENYDHDSPSTFLFVGRIEEDKGIYDLLDAFQSIKSAQPIKLIFVGTGSCLPALRTRVGQSPIKNAIDILGYVPHDQIFSLMKKADAVVTPTQSKFPEGRCMSVMEAFFVGTPVIAPNYGPFPYLVKNNVNGILYPADSVIGLNSALLEIINKNNIIALRQGALKSGIDLMQPKKSFAQTVHQVVNLK